MDLAERKKRRRENKRGPKEEKEREQEQEMIQVSVREGGGLFVLAGLGIIYWLRDIFFFNKMDEADILHRRFSRTQMQALGMMMLWAFFEWVAALQTRRGQLEWFYPSSVARHTVGFYMTTLLANDSIQITNHQLKSYFLGLLITLLWASFSYLVYAEE